MAIGIHMRGGGATALAAMLVAALVDMTVLFDDWKPLFG